MDTRIKVLVINQVIERLENKQFDGTITMDEQAQLIRLIQLVEFYLYSK